MYSCACMLPKAASNEQIQIFEQLKYNFKLSHYVKCRDIADDVLAARTQNGSKYADSTQPLNDEIR